MLSCFKQKWEKSMQYYNVPFFFFESWQKINLWVTLLICPNNLTVLFRCDSADSILLTAELWRLYFNFWVSKQWLNFIYLCGYKFTLGLCPQHEEDFFVPRYEVNVIIFVPVAVLALTLCEIWNDLTLTNVRIHNSKPAGYSTETGRLKLEFSSKQAVNIHRVLDCTLTCSFCRD